MDNMRVAVVTAGQVFNEFSSGTPDATAFRRLMKMLYDRAATAQDAPKYLLLFGDGFADNRLITLPRYNPDNYLLMHAMGPNVAGVIGSAVAAGFLMAVFGG
jgi:hypothetical protein